MAKVIVESFLGFVVLEYPECPYADMTRVGGITCPDFYCKHPNRKLEGCGSNHTITDDCPFDLHKELYG